MAQPLLKVIAQAPPGQVDDVEKGESGAMLAADEARRAVIDGPGGRGRIGGRIGQIPHAAVHRSGDPWSGPSSMDRAVGSMVR